MGKQANLCLTWSEILKTGFLNAGLNGSDNILQQFISNKRREEIRVRPSSTFRMNAKFVSNPLT